MEEFFAYHVVTERPMQVGQHIVFDESHHSGVYKRVMEKANLVNKIYSNPSFCQVGQLDHHTSVAFRELALEEVRKAGYPAYPSRLGCLYVSDTIAESEKWSALFAEWGRPTYHIVKLKIRGRRFTGDANNCFEATANRQENLLMAERYWKNAPNPYGEDPIREILVDGMIEVVEIIKEINLNMHGFVKKDPGR